MLILTTIAEFRKKNQAFILCISWEISFGVNQKNTMWASREYTTILNYFDAKTLSSHLGY